MPSTSERAVVFIRLSGMDYVPAGLLRHDDRAYFFRYGRRYLERPDAIPLDPARMPLADMEFSGSTLFSALRDAAPDRWGRKVLGLMAGRAPGTLSEFEVLTAAHHPQRMGALAFGPTPDGPASLAPWATGDAFCMVPEDLGRVAAIVARVDEVEDDEVFDAVRSGMPEDAFLAALASSLSLGGARPKAMITLDGTSWIAKFSKRGDPWREPVVEHATMTLAARCGITVASTRLMELDGHFVLLVERFDRLSGGSRHVISGFTVTGAEEDGDWGSYQNLAEQARRLGDADSGPEIFRRMAFNVLCSNRDDHLRNHAFFVSRKTIAMTPAYDLVPSAIRFRQWDLSLRCGLEGRAATRSNILSDVRPFGLSESEARRTWEEMWETTAGWREHFAGHGVTKREMEELSQRFALAKAASTGP
ncbi:serine/threonine-protein kinase HipA [Desulfomicrobium norvegicum]|uniref:Serine/threonine-protein kinase HipA n=1 Tax=Desulfomicrobium norvegicum (strain DSM 1741 / NCIMB 8310) TaxID=52561 RepID=A0A8G2C4N8_DESNO|nr:HipA domain-containing protein [Desulfomicrobium norvegicum]SFM00519.1 serine/threonine-protein kinase HipA [Desulfomicrobium norvegicum]